MRRVHREGGVADRDVLGAAQLEAIDESRARSNCLFREDGASAHGIVLQFRASLLEANLAPASINRALGTMLVYRDEHDRMRT